ncbi:hypothetical protein GQ600_19101 [Phytophthora cactorum]|nr:hypothetical protein GQ600_19101 [Phytophthora cactorum]
MKKCFCVVQEKLADLITVRDDCAKTFKETYSDSDACAVFNTDEPGIYYDTPPSKMLSEKGKSATITSGQKHSARLIAVCTVSCSNMPKRLWDLDAGSRIYDFPIYDLRSAVYDLRSAIYNLRSTMGAMIWRWAGAIRHTMITPQRYRPDGS